MGSGNASNRKQHDKPIIRTPKNIVVTGGISGTKKNRQDLIAEQCELSFQIRVKESDFTRNGVRAELVKKDSVYCVQVHGIEVATLTPGRSAMVETCLRLKVQYSGEIVTDNHKYYARFTRVIH